MGGSQGSQSSGLTGGMAWAFQDPEHGSTTSRAASSTPTTTFVNPEYQPLSTHRSQVCCLKIMTKHIQMYPACVSGVATACGKASV